MPRCPKINRQLLSLFRTRTTKKRTIIVGLNSDNSTREILLRLLTSVVVPGDNVLAVHVLESNDSFDPNTFHIHEDLCRSKQVDFQVKVCEGESYIAELTYHVRVNFATILAVGCSSPWPKSSTVGSCLRALPPTCSLLVMDNGGRILMQMQGTSQEGSASKVLQSSVSSVSNYSNSEQSRIGRQIRKSLTMPSSSKPPALQIEDAGRNGMRKTLHLQLPDPMTKKLFQRLAALELRGCGRRFTSEELGYATNDFGPELVIGEGEKSVVYRARLDDDQPVAVRVLKNYGSSADELFREVEILSSLTHENVVQLVGYCYSKGVHAIVYNLLQDSLKQNLEHLRWRERMRIAIGVAKALEYLHSRSPPIVHGDVKSSSILLSYNCHPQLSGFGAAVVHQPIQPTKPRHAVGTFGHLAPEYMRYGKVDEKIDVYSYGVVLLELITGKEAIVQTNQPSNHESLVLQARYLLSCGLCERLIDPNLNEDFDKNEMKIIMVAARLCLLHSSSRRPTMKTILELFEEPEHWLKMQRKREELLNGICNISSRGETSSCQNEDFDSNGRSHLR